MFDIFGVKSEVTVNLLSVILPPPCYNSYLVFFKHFLLSLNGLLNILNVYLKRDGMVGHLNGIPISCIMFQPLQDPFM